MASENKIKYHVSFENAKNHYANISIKMACNKGQNITVKMPVWTPGSYKIREFSQHVDKAVSIVDEQRTKPKRIDKNTWQIKAETDEVFFHYQLYAAEIAARVSYVDQFMAFLHGASAFVYFEGFENLPIEISFDMPFSWENIEMALPKKEPNGTTFLCENYDLLVDSPVALGNFDISEFDTFGVPHKIVMIGEGNYNLETVTNDIKKICDTETAMFGGKHPSERYIHFIQNIDNGGGGLEHLNCQTSQITRWAYSNPDKYRTFLALVSHEYFHLWNVKRIRPIELGPFDYGRENYTEMLWIVEGVTSYFDDLFLIRSGFHTTETYFAALASNINRLESQAGRNVMTLNESSKLAWIKAYLPNENSNNTSISYYNKGMLVAWFLDFEIMKNTNGRKRLDHVMQTLMNEFYEKQNRGFTFDEFKNVVNQIGENDYTSFFNRFVFETGSFPYAEYLSLAGVQLKNITENKPEFGTTSSSENGKIIIKTVKTNSAAANAGICANDEIIAINNWRASGSLQEIIDRYRIGSTINVLINRDGKLHHLEATLLENADMKYAISINEQATNEQKHFLKNWLS
ncbi:MAG: M61 family metallopeptidase [Flavobacteriales bacterium]|nr:M61 family metallopeptidase [Flavobacteriales bacterium]